MMVIRLNNEGYHGGVRLPMAICIVFLNHCQENKIDLKGGNYTLSHDTNIPRQTGLSGSTAIVCAALNCFLDFYKVRHLISVETRPNLIVSADKELGIVTGLQDRVALVTGVWWPCFYVVVKMGNGVYISMDISLLPPLYLIDAKNASDSGKVHSRQRWLNGDEFILSMEEVANIALLGQHALMEKNYTEFAQLLNHNFDLRRVASLSVDHFSTTTSEYCRCGWLCPWMQTVPFEFLHYLGWILFEKVDWARNALAYATHKFFQENVFVSLTSAIITASDCEGAGEQFFVTTLVFTVLGMRQKKIYFSNGKGNNEKAGSLQGSGLLEGRQLFQSRNRTER